MLNIKKITDIFAEECNYNNINNKNLRKMRNCINGLQLIDAFYYRFLYAKKEMTKERAVSIINNTCNREFTRLAYEYKENNIPLKIYSNILKKLQNSFKKSLSINENDYKLTAIDGTYNNDRKINEILNIGLYNITDGIPIDIRSYGKYNKNQEIASVTKYIKKNWHSFKNTIIVADRGYFSYEFIDFLIAHNLKFIIRAKGDAKNLTSPIKSNIKNYEKVMNIRRSSKVITYENFMNKTVYASNSKKKINKYQLQMKNNCVIVTNLCDDQKYTDDKLLELYRSRWDIEVYFKFIKSNFKFQLVKEHDIINHKKMYICELIITYIAKIIENDYMQTYKKQQVNGYTYKINKTNLINGIFDTLLRNILYKKLTKNIYDKFCKSYIKITQNKTGRSFPRTAKTPFTKWYVKGYSNQTKYMNIINAVINDTIDKLHSNLKTIAYKIISINGKMYQDKPS